ncbi:zf-HC2 domain-containing protein [Paenibacillus turpanensis]|uniref:zf-HC2 domain-containing protein n=1 Tax=Paenibacillus turpanensis TaxID=2689078 RepID=UPI00140DE546|nr:zf-HC2 domain-containing protein [Paenibacillus turpanensis]
MKCSDVTELFGDYWDLPRDDFRRQAVDEHVKRCASCAEEFEIWRESNELIRSTGGFELPLEQTGASVSMGVMDRIYADEGWRVPVQERVFAIPRKLRLRIMGVVAFSLALFLFSFIYSFTFQEPVDEFHIFSADTSGLMPVANALGEAKVNQLAASGMKGVPVASLSDPFILKMGSVTYHPNYVLACSFLGLVGALLILNWFARTRS